MASLIRRAAGFLTRGRAHRRRLAALDKRIVVTGTRGKSTTVEWLYEALEARGLDTYAKVTGEVPMSLYNGESHEIERDGPVRLYETAREIRRFDPQDAIIVENQGIREYTGRLVNETYVDPTLAVLTNVRRDHLDTMGRDLGTIARSLVRSIPSGTTVVAGERNTQLREWIEHELAKRDVRVIHAFDDVDGTITPAEELIAIVETALAELELEPLAPEERATFRNRLPLDWVHHPEGRAYHAATVNDVESTDVVRRSLTNGVDEPITPIIYFRADRPGRTASFIDYLNRLAAAGLVDRVHALGAHRPVVTRRLMVPVEWHDERTADPVAVLEAAFEDGEPVLTMGNGVPQFMRDLEAAIDIRAAVLAGDRPTADETAERERVDVEAGRVEDEDSPLEEAD